jgi:pimeloyl-ACP methyl ester carboxylesterase
MTEVVVQHAGQDVAVRDLGGPGPDVMLLHGLGTNLASWDRVTALVRDRFRLVLVDLPGHGRSTVPEPHSFDGDLAAVDAVRTTLDLRSPTAVGHSFGGMIAVALAADRPGSYRGAVNVDGTGFAHPDTPAALRAVWEADEDPWPDVGDADWMETELAADQQELVAAGVPTDVIPDDLLRRGFALGPDGRWSRKPPAAHYLAVARGLRGLDLLAYYTRAACPTVTGLAARRDQPTPELAAATAGHIEAVRRDLQRLPTAQVVDLPGGHYGLLEEPAAVASLLLDVCS